MFDETPIEKLESLKNTLFFVGAIATTILGIVAATTETHRDVVVKINGEQVTKRKRNKWFYITVIGISIATIITIFSYLIDEKIDKRTSADVGLAKKKFEESVDSSFKRSITRLEKLDSSASKLVNDLRTVSSQTSDIVKFTEQEMFPIEPLAMHFFYAVEMPFDEFRSRLPQYGNLITEKNRSSSINIGKKELEQLDEKERGFLLKYLSGVYLTPYLSLKSITWSKRTESQGWINLDEGKLNLFYASISGDSNKVHLTIQMKLEGLKIVNAGFTQIKSLKDIIGKYFICCFEERGMNRIQYFRLLILSGNPLSQKMEINLSSKDSTNERPKCLVTKITLNHFKKKYEGP